MIAIAQETADLAKSLGGVMSGEHGDGRARGPLLEHFYGPEIMTAFRAVKAVFDPRNLLNPGNIVEPRPIASIAQRLRIAPHERPVTVPPEIETYFDYTDAHGFDGAVEMCNGAGVCRKKQGGTMCPSYQATLDERHSTRGRGNALRLAITGQSGPLPAAWSDPGTLETLDLCLSCKACKTECPSNVDIARLKAEFTAQRFKSLGRAPLTARFFGAIRTLNRLGSLTPGLANAVNRFPLTRALANAALGFHPKRSLPLFARSLARDWGRDAPTDGPTVALFGDCFTMFNEPGIGRATRRVLEAFGYRVVLADAGCCARAKISLGLLPEAIDEADATLARLQPLIDDPNITAILFAEPSCLSAIKDDWLSLRLRTPLDVRKRLAARSFLPEDFLHRQWDRHPKQPRFHAPGEVLLHAHCHQKALWGAESSGALLRRVFGEKFRTLDTGCCGMAGSFGYAKHRYDLSMKIGALTLFPALAAAPSAAIAAPGSSCRHQIHDGAKRTAHHPMEILAESLA
jgi:Fe-S oxidoreductase